MAALKAVRPRPVSVVCVDDHSGFRAVVGDLIAATPGFVLIGEASSGVEAVALVPQLRPDLVLMDVHMPGMSGFEAMEALASRGCVMPMVLMSADPIALPPGHPLRSVVRAFVMKHEISRQWLLDLCSGLVIRSG